MDILPQLLVNAIIAGSIYALASVGLSLTYGLLRILNFAHGHMMMVGVYFFYLCSQELGFNIWLSGGASLLFAIVFSIIALKVFILPFSRYSFILTFVTTLALSNMLESLVSMIFGVNVKSLGSSVSMESYEVAGVFFTPIQVVIVVSALAILSFTGFVIHSTSLGRKVRALSQDPFAARSLGISQAKMSYLVFAFATCLAMYAGVLIGYETNMQPTMGGSYTIKAFAAMILGGLGNIWGTLAGSYILGLVENLGIGLDFGGYSIPAGYKDAFAFVIILFVLLFKPNGIFKSKGRET